MIRNFILKEIIETVLGPKFLVTFLISLTLILTSVYSGYRLYESEKGWFTRATAKNMERMENLGSYGVLKNQGTKVLRKPQVLSVFVRGVDSAVGRSSMVSSDVNNTLKDSRMGLNPIFAVFGELDLAFIVKLVLALFALLFSYTAISGEREQGTLKLVLSNSVKRSTYILGKTIGGLIPLYLTLLIPLLISLVMLITFFDISFSAEEWGRLALITLVFLLYLTTFYLIGMFLSSVTRRSAVTFLLALGVWVLSVGVLPKVSVEIASQISPAPSIDDIEAERVALMREYNGQLGPLLEKGLQELFASGVTVNNQNWLETENAAKAQAREKIADREKQILQAYKRDQKKLLETAMNIARLSPTSCLTFSLNRLSQTDASITERFEQAIDRYRSEFLNFLDAKMIQYPGQVDSGIGVSVSRKDDGSVEINASVPHSKIDVNGISEFRMEDERLEESFSASIADISILILEIVLFFALSIVFFARYDVR